MQHRKRWKIRKEIYPRRVGKHGRKQIRRANSRIIPWKGGKEEKFQPRVILNRPLIEQTRDDPWNRAGGKLLINIFRGGISSPLTRRPIGHQNFPSKTVMDSLEPSRNSDKSASIPLVKYVLETRILRPIFSTRRLRRSEIS